jgi:hypothetical protein
MTKPAHHCKRSPAATAKVINLGRSVATIAKTNDAGSLVTSDPRSNYFANSNGSRWGRNFRSK